MTTVKSNRCYPWNELVGVKPCSYQLFQQASVILEFGASDELFVSAKQVDGFMKDDDEAFMI